MEILNTLLGESEDIPGQHARSLWHLSQGVITEEFQLTDAIVVSA